MVHPGAAGPAADRRAATTSEAQALATPTRSTICACRGVSLSDGVPIACFESLFPLDRLPGIDDALTRTNSVTQALLQAGVADYTRASTRLTAILADATLALQLQVNEGDPLLRSTGINVNGDSVPVEYGRTWFAGDRVTLTLQDTDLDG
ncbi:UTRA domain-containing protein [Sulfitobacter sp. TSTF-M16]|uniref:UTRA domain-containing protein n=1 Tax=Sulfitobacter aestuariivivens TaxID=2766981 RepID=A0A927HER2_9RHOB|nr:UTRA domain-containing protein [Sulfitobacter aestuariivivens]